MQNDQTLRRTHSIDLGFALIAFATAALVMVNQVDAPRTPTGDPGPRMFPIVMSLFLLGGGIWEIVCALFFGRQRADRDERSLGTRAGRLLLAISSLTAYVLLLPFLGFASASIVFGVSWIVGLRANWRRAMISLVAIVLVIEILFRKLFHVQLPEGSSLFAIDPWFVGI